MRPKRKKKPQLRPPPLTVAQILRWAGEWHERTGRWPKRTDGVIPGSGGDTWQRLNVCLREGHRGLPGGSSLARLLAAERGVRNHLALEPLTEPKILSWADAFFGRTGCWPTGRSGAISDAPGETWSAVDQALKDGVRGLSRGSSLALLLHQLRGTSYQFGRPPFSEETILEWADAFERRLGQWPTRTSGNVAEAPGTTWSAVNDALSKGLRGLPGGSSLATLLERRRGVKNVQNLPRLTCRLILTWAREHRRQTGDWPRKNSGAVAAAPGETWINLDGALNTGRRGLPGGSSLARLLKRPVASNASRRPLLTLDDLLAWAREHRAQTGEWPGQRSGPVAGAPGESWANLDAALRAGRRGLPRGLTLARLLERDLGVPHPHNRLPLTLERILDWAREHHERTGKWPHNASGPIVGADGEAWGNVSEALQRGWRGLPGGLTLTALLERERGIRSPRYRPLTLDLILAWALEHQRATGQRPRQSSGPVSAAPGETWANLDSALATGRRGLPGGSSLAKLFKPSAPEE